MCYLISEILLATWVTMNHTSVAHSNKTGIDFLPGERLPARFGVYVHKTSETFDFCELESKLGIYPGNQ